MFSFFVSPPENQFLEDAFELGPVYKEWILLFFFFVMSRGFSYVGDSAIESIIN